MTDREALEKIRDVIAAGDKVTVNTNIDLFLALLNIQTSIEDILDDIGLPVPIVED